MMTKEDILFRVKEDIGYIETKYPNEHLTPECWLALVGEEVGELFMSVNDKEIDNLVSEGCQVCATVICMLADIMNNNNYAGVSDEKLFKITSQNRDHFVRAKDAITAIKKIKKHKENKNG